MGVMLFVVTAAAAAAAVVVVGFACCYATQRLVWSCVLCAVALCALSHSCAFAFGSLTPPQVDWMTFLSRGWSSSNNFACIGTLPPLFRAWYVTKKGCVGGACVCMLRSRLAHFCVRVCVRACVCMCVGAVGDVTMAVVSCVRLNLLA